MYGSAVKALRAIAQVPRTKKPWIWEGETINNRERWWALAFYKKWRFLQVCLFITLDFCSNLICSLSFASFPPIPIFMHRISLLHSSQTHIFFPLGKSIISLPKPSRNLGVVIQLLFPLIPDYLFSKCFSDLSYFYLLIEASIPPLQKWNYFLIISPILFNPPIYTPIQTVFQSYH